MIPKFHLMTKTDSPQLLRILKTRLPQSAMAFNVAHLHVTGKFSSRVRVTFFNFNGNKTTVLPNEDSLILVRLERNYTKPFYMISIPKNFQSQSPRAADNLLMALDRIIDWTVENKFGSLPLIICPAILRLLEKRGQVITTGGSASAPLRTKGRILDGKLTSPDTTKFDNILLRPLSKEVDAKIVAESWIYRQFNTNPLEVVKECIDLGASAGVYVKKGGKSSGGGDSNLVEYLLGAWILLKTTGDIGILHVMDKYRGKGYAKLVVNSIVQSVLDLGCIPVMEMATSQAEAHNLASKLGFNLEYETIWLNYKPIK